MDFQGEQGLSQKPCDEKIGMRHTGNWKEFTVICEHVWISRCVRVDIDTIVDYDCFEICCGRCVKTFEIRYEIVRLSGRRTA